MKELITDEIMKKAYTYLMRNENGNVEDFLRRDTGPMKNESFYCNISKDVIDEIYKSFAQAGYISFGVDAIGKLRFHTTSDGRKHATLAYAALMAKEILADIQF